MERPSNYRPRTSALVQLDSADSQPDFSASPPPVPSRDSHRRRTTDDLVGSNDEWSSPYLDASPTASQRLVSGASSLASATAGSISSLKKRALQRPSSVPGAQSPVTSAGLSPPPRPPTRPTSSPRGVARTTNNPNELSLPDCLLDQPVVICSLKWPSWFLSIDESSTFVQSYKGNKVCSHPGAFWRITRADTDKYYLSPVFQAGIGCALSLNNELVVDGTDKGFFSFKFLRSSGAYIIRPDFAADLLITINEKGEAKAEKPKRGVISNRTSFFICPVSSIAKRIFFDYIVDMNSDFEENIPIRFNLDWMKKVADTTYLTQIWIPGTHDTGSYPGHSVKMVDTLARTQSFTITNQLRAGIRFFDIRLRHYRDQLLVYHGNIFCNECWAGVLYKIRDFLTENPTECVITKIQQEYTPSNNSFSTWGSLVNEGLEEISEDFRWTQSRIPMMGEVRGKVVVTTWSPLLNSEYPDLGFIPWGGVCKEDEKYFIQDEFFGPSIDKKWKLMIQLWMRAYKYQTESPEPPPFFFANHASATRVVTYQLNALGPKKYAKQVHSRLLPAVLMGPHAPQIFLMDFPSVDLIEAIIERNYSSPTQPTINANTQNMTLVSL